MRTLLCCVAILVTFFSIDGSNGSCHEQIAASARAAELACAQLDRKGDTVEIIQRLNGYFDDFRGLADGKMQPLPLALIHHGTGALVSLAGAYVRGLEDLPITQTLVDQIVRTAREQL